MGPVSLFAGWFKTSTTITSTEGDALIFSLARRGAGQYTIGRESFLVSPERGVFQPPDMGARYTTGDDYDTLTLVFNQQAMEAHLQALSGIHMGKPLRFEPRFDGSTGGGADVLRLLTFVVGEFDRPSAMTSSRFVLAHLRDALMTAVIVGQPHSHSHHLQPSPQGVSSACVRNAEAYIDAHIHEPFTIADMSRALGLSVRSIQHAFQFHRDYSPTQFIKSRRLELARRRILSAQPGATITDIACECGFHHFGRFSSEYRKTFGETPSTTLRRVIGGLESIPRRTG